MSADGHFRNTPAVLAALERMVAFLEVNYDHNEEAMKACQAARAAMTAARPAPALTAFTVYCTLIGNFSHEIAAATAAEAVAIVSDKWHQLIPDILDGLEVDNTGIYAQPSEGGDK